MADFESKNAGGIYLYEWKEGQLAGLSIQIDKLHDDSKGNPTGEILLKYPPVYHHLHQTRYSLLSTRSRKEVANYCKSRLEGPDWDWLLELVSVKTITSYREGEPVQRLGDIVAPEHIHYRLPPYLIEGAPNVIYGYGGLGKSIIAAYLATLVQEAYPVGTMIPEPGPVLYLDYEASPESQSRRFKHIYQGLELDPNASVLYRFCHLSLATDIQHIQRIVIERGIQLVIIDSAGPACGGEPEKSGPAISFFVALRSLRVTSLVVAHKNKTDTGIGPFGSVYWWNYPRNIYEIKRQQDVESNTIHVAMIHRKANDDMLHKPQGLSINFGLGAITLGMESIKDIPEFEGEMAIKDRIVDTLSHGAMTIKDIAQELSEKEDSIRHALNRGKDKTFVQVGTNLGNVLWGLLHR